MKKDDNIIEENNVYSIWPFATSVINFRIQNGKCVDFKTELIY